MSKLQRERELHVLKVIAETLNHSNDLYQMLQSVLTSLLQVTGLSTGWIFLVKSKPNYELVASSNLPEALSSDTKRMCEGVCHCLAEYWNSKLVRPVNIIECKRLNDAKKYKWGSTNGITHHATVPIADGNEQLGILNVASAGKQLFTNEELNLLQLVSLQIGPAIKRLKLYQEQKQRADNLSKLDEVVQHIWSKQSVKTLLQKTMKLCREHFHWSHITFYIKEGDHLKPYILNEYKSNKKIKSIPLSHSNEITKSFHEQDIIISYNLRLLTQLDSHGQGKIAIISPLLVLESQPIGVIVVADDQNQMNNYNHQLVRTLSEHVSLAIQQIRMNERRQQLVVYEERNRLARDLHDSVNQKLFSLTMMSRGVQEVLKDKSEGEIVQSSLKNIQALSQEALAEMKELIWQLRPAGIEKGLATALEEYGQSLGLEVTSYVYGLNLIPRMIEETLWRIGQEALNNVKKHAQINKAMIELHMNQDNIQLLVSDKGIGFRHCKQLKSHGNLGLVTMKERVKMLNGTIQITSKFQKGTEISVCIPYK